MITKEKILKLLKKMPEKFSTEEIIARIMLLDQMETRPGDIEHSSTIGEVEEKYGKMKSLLINIKNPSERKILLAILKSLKMSYTKINQQSEDKALLKTMEKGKVTGRAGKKEQQAFESWLKSV